MRLEIPTVGLVLLLASLLMPCQSRAEPDDGTRARKRGGSAVASLRGPGPNLSRPECGPAPTEIFCDPEGTPTRPACDGFIGDPMFLWLNDIAQGAVYCRRESPPSDHEAWLASHPESCRPGEAQQTCSVLISFGEIKGSCPEYESNSEYYRIYPLNSHGGHKGLAPRPEEFYGVKPVPSERTFCRRLELIEAEQKLAQRKAADDFRRDLIQKSLIAIGVLIVAFLAWVAARKK